MKLRPSLSPRYAVRDVFSHPGENYTYVFGVCEDVAASSELVAGASSKCASTSGSAREIMDSDVAGYQIFHRGSREGEYSECNRLSGSLGDDSVDDAAGDDQYTVAGPHGASAAQWGLVDPMNPAQGVYGQ